MQGWGSRPRGQLSNRLLPPRNENELLAPSGPPSQLPHDRHLGRVTLGKVTFFRLCRKDTFMFQCGNHKYNTFELPITLWPRGHHYKCYFYLFS